MARVKNKYGLTPNQEQFCNLMVFGDELISGNATECYKKSYNVSKETNPKTINHMACELMKNPNITQRIEMFNEELSLIYRTDAEGTKKRILSRLWSIAEDNTSSSVNALRLIAQSTPDFFIPDKIEQNQNITVNDSIQELDVVLHDIMNDEKVVSLFAKGGIAKADEDAE